MLCQTVRTFVNKKRPNQRKLTDIYDQIYQAIAPRLPRKGDAELLKLLLDRQREGGKEAVEQKIEELIKKLEGD
jgi:hypothetical protein